MRDPDTRHKLAQKEKIHDNVGTGDRGKNFLVQAKVVPRLSSTMADFI